MTPADRCQCRNPNAGLPLNATVAQGLRPKKKTHNTGAIVGATIGAFVAGVLLLAIIVGASQLIPLHCCC